MCQSTVIVNKIEAEDRQNNEFSFCLPDDHEEIIYICVPQLICEMGMIKIFIVLAQ